MRFPKIVPVKLTQELIHVFGNIAGRPGAFLLDSGGDNLKDGRYSFAGINPTHTFSSYGGFVTIDGHACIDNSFSALQRFIADTACTAPADPYLPFTGGLVGFASFEWGNSRGGVADSDYIPDVFFGFYDTVITYDRLEGAAWITSLDEARADEKIEGLLSLLQVSPCERRNYPPINGRHPIVSALSKDGFINGVKALKNVEHLPLFAQRFASPTHKTPWQAYLDLRCENQVPYGAYLNCGDFHILCASRTRLMSISNDVVTSKPTKGSRGRTANPEEDARKINELQYNEEIQSSHRYVVTDIMKNLDDVCSRNSIETDDVAHIESDRRAHHLVTNISGKKERDVGVFDCLLKIMPAFSDGRIAPIVSRLEKRSRNIYTGTIGFISCNGAAEFNSAFRTMVLKDTIGYLHAGTEIGMATDAEEAFFNTAKTADKIFALMR